MASQSRAARLLQKDVDDVTVSTPEKVSQAERAYIELKRLILDNELPAGSQLLEAEASDLLGMSRTPTREAMLRLQTEGLVEIRSRHGMRVLPLSSRDVREMYEILTGLESIAAYQVAKRGVSEAEMESLRAAIDAMDAALTVDDLTAWAKADEQFHSQLVSLSKNQRLIAVVNQFVEQAHRARMLTLKLRPKPIQSNRDHEALIDALIQKDAESARQIHHDHRERAKQTIVELLERLGF
ncbi:GntR family transcriptional regulator [Rhizobium sp. CNPSo 3490]|uniref:GntR family transcriptional regulator n=1 Tax=Rhizobium sp. CNPSo 3490 TaxID=3021407 RepID=UPI00254F1283|nr:GntR family transcriptional regulator [Rhizobium sp. CNPSo 3490]MDK4731464.1 GntR family transcriptional regulator [Rhizobium sp. CNPSo 3490]